MRELVRYILNNFRALPLTDWSVQGFGFLRLRIAPSVRVHIWNSRLRLPGVSDVHDHTQWAFTSHIISRAITNARFAIANPGEGEPYMMGRITTGMGGGLHRETVQEVRLAALTPEFYLPGQSYHQEPDEIHQTRAPDGAVTLLYQQRRENESARVFWKPGTEWGDAEPRAAAQAEVDEVVEHALAHWASN